MGIKQKEKYTGGGHAHGRRGGTSASGRIYMNHDTEAEVRTISHLFAQERHGYRQAPQPGHLQNARSGQAARARSAVLQAPFLTNEILRLHAGSSRARCAEEFAAKHFGCGAKHGQRHKEMVGQGKTDSTHSPEGLFNKDAGTIARTLVSKKSRPRVLDPA